MCWKSRRHGSGDKVYLIRFHYLPPGGWDRIDSRIARRKNSGL